MSNPIHEAGLAGLSIHGTMVTLLTERGARDPEDLATHVLSLLSPDVSMALAFGDSQDAEDVPIHRWVEVICREYARGILAQLSPGPSVDPARLDEIAEDIAEQIGGHLFADLFARFDYAISGEPQPAPHLDRRGHTYTFPR